MSGKHFLITFSRRKKKTNEPTDNGSNVREGEKENGKANGEVEEEENGKVEGVLLVPSSSAELQGQNEEEKGDGDGQDARKPIENGVGCSSSISRSPARKRKSDVGGEDGGNLRRKQQPKQKKQKVEKQSQQGKQRKEEVLKVKPKEKQEEKKQKGENGGERVIVMKKAEQKGRKKKKEEEEEEEESSAGCRIPMRRVVRIIRSEGSDCRITQEAVFLINQATEMFLEVFCEDSYECAAQDCKNYVSYNHLSSVVCKQKRFDFLSDYVPEKVKADKGLG